MTNMLTPTFGIPLEREFEVWITQQIEDYFVSLHIPIHTFAVSPADEKSWPVDEALLTHGKLIGLQFKRPCLAARKGSVDFSSLYWSLSGPKGQAETIVRCPEIYYCLPAFINRWWRREGLTHAIFWRPGPGTYRPGHTEDLSIWYDNPGSRMQTQNVRISRDPNAYRWGEFVERIFGCSVPAGYNREKSAQEVLRRILSTYKEAHPPTDGDNHVDGSGATELLHFMYFPTV